MKILLPPSETKRVGGDGPPLDLTTLALPSLHRHREEVVQALIDLASDEQESRRILKLSERQRGEVAHNRTLRESPTMAAVDRYTGVLYDALDAAVMDAVSRRWLGDHVWIHSAPFGPMAALDLVPAYRLAAGTSLPGVPPLRRHWAAATSAALAAAEPSLVLDLRSEAYVALGPIPPSVPSAYVRVVKDDDGATRALNHFNKKTKGELVRALAEHRADLRTVDALLAWCSDHGFVMRRPESGVGVLELCVSD